ncbi:hypothetical protein ACW23B_05870 [Streptomyces albidoflavus]
MTANMNPPLAAGPQQEHARGGQRAETGGRVGVVGQGEEEVDAGGGGQRAEVDSEALRGGGRSRCGEAGQRRGAGAG